MGSTLLPLSTPPPKLNHSHALPQLTRNKIYTLLEQATTPTHLNQILPLIVKSNLLSTEHYFQTKLISLFSNFANLHAASLIFNNMQQRKPIDPLIYHTILKGHTKNSSVDTTLLFFTRMKGDGVAPVVYNYAYIMKMCGEKGELKKGREMHCDMVKNGFGGNLFAMTAVLNMYAKCGCVEEGYKMFERLPERDVVAWNAMVAGFAQNGLGQKALEMVKGMQEEGVRPDSVTVVTVLPACTQEAGEECLRIGRSVHGYVVRSGFELLVNVGTALINLYAKCGVLRTARLVFDRMDGSGRNVVSWNSMIDGYAESGDSEEAMVIFERMIAKGLKLTDVSIMGALQACADLGDFERGKYVHELANRVGLGMNVLVTNSLIAMYSKCKRVDVAAELFKNLKDKTIVSWNAMILGFAQNGCVNEALDHFCELYQGDLKPDSFTLVSVILAIAELSILRQAKWIHGIVIRSFLDRNVYVMTALVDMYTKCGGIRIARKLFDMMDVRHVMTWNAMIDGYGTHGLGKAAVELFEVMKKGALQPNNITFLCVLSACSHSRLVDEGRRYFSSMKQDYGLEPGLDHYGTMVDLLGRAGRLDEAWDFIQKMPVEPGISVYGAMLGACKIHKNVGLGRQAAEKLFELEPEEAGYHVLLANIYASASMWDEVANVRELMKKKGLSKTPGCSVVECKNEVHSFYSGSITHPQSDKIYAKLKVLGNKIKAAGYVPDTNSIHDVEGDVQEQLLNSHSEKLAIAFGLINTAPGTTIHIRKNLRVCGDCHNATKYISLVTGREIVVRDMHRFHHFKEGNCSCGDYW